MPTGPDFINSSLQGEGFSAAAGQEIVVTQQLLPPAVAMALLVADQIRCI